MRLFYSRSILFVFVCLLALPLLGCAARSPEQQSPVAESAPAFSDSGSDTVPAKWWQTFGDTQLNQLVDTALEQNFTLKTAWSRLRQARAVVDREEASLFPSLDGTASGEISRTDNTDNERLSLGLTAEYEVDLWGRIQSSVQAERYRARATLADYRTAAISLSAEVTRTWYQLLEQKQQLDLLNQQIKTNRSVYELLKTRFERGQIQSADLLRQQQLMESTREQKITVESRIRVLEHQLAVLLGQNPQSGLAYRPDTMPKLPPLPRTGLPAELIRRRPDVRSAYRQLQAADRDLAAAISNQYPRLTLTASLTTTDDDATELFDEWARSFAGELTAPLIDAGQRDAEVRRSRAVKYQRLHEYGQAILTAFRDVEDALVQERKQQQRIRNLRSQIELATETVKRLRSRYLNGTTDYIDVLNALTEEQQLRRDLLTARQTLREHRIALYRALAGGFKSPQQTDS